MLGGKQRANGKKIGKKEEKKDKKRIKGTKSFQHNTEGN
jgi:hypothetical protein